MYKVVVIFIIGLIQATGLEYVNIFGAKPDILFMLVVYFALYVSREDAIKAAILGGLFKDITSTALFGSNAAGFCLCALFLSRFGNHFYKQKISAQVLLCGVLYYFTILVVFGINHTKIVNINFSVYSWIILKGAVYTGLVSPLVFFVLSKVFKDVLFTKKYI